MALNGAEMSSFKRGFIIIIIDYHKKKQKARVFNVPHTGQKKKSMAFLMAHSILKVLSETLVWMDELIEFHQPTVRCPPTPRSWVSCQIWRYLSLDTDVIDSLPYIPIVIIVIPSLWVSEMLSSQHLSAYFLEQI